MEPARIAAQDVRRRLEAGEPLAIVDARSEDAWSSADEMAADAIRVPPEHAGDAVAAVPRDKAVVTYCT